MHNLSEQLQVETTESTRIQKNKNQFGIRGISSETTVYPNFLRKQIKHGQLKNVF